MGRRARSRPVMKRVARRLPAALALFICVGYGLGNTIWSATVWEIPDVGAYWNAAIRLREGAALYPEFADVNASEVYRYAPWFAYAWIPLTYLPRWMVDGGWSAVLVGASISVLLPAFWLGDRAAIAFTAIIGSFMILIASRGNVQPLMILVLAFGVERRSGPFWIALCASLKATPILYALVYAMRGEWMKFAVTISLTGILVAPIALFDLTAYTTDPGISHSLYSLSPILFGMVAVISVLVAIYIAWRHRPWAWLAVSVAVIFCLPRYFPYELTFLFVGLVPVVDAWRHDRELAASR